MKAAPVEELFVFADAFRAVAGRPAFVAGEWHLVGEGDAIEVELAASQLGRGDRLISLAYDVETPGYVKGEVIAGGALLMIGERASPFTSRRETYATLGAGRNLFAPVSVNLTIVAAPVKLRLSAALDSGHRVAGVIVRRARSA